MLQMMNDELSQILHQNGASLVGFANLQSLVDGDMIFGVSVATAVPAHVIQSIQNGPTLEYYKEYFRLNQLLNRLVTLGADFLAQRGYKAFAQTTDAVVESDDYRTVLPHKTVATRAGLGWIGKCALLVTKEYGSAVRLSSLITNAPLECAVPINDSQCGNCRACTSACPGQAVLGKSWNVNIDRNEFFNPDLCRKAARELAAKHIHKEITLCGKCIQVCPYTQNYLRKETVPPHSEQL